MIERNITNELRKNLNNDYLIILVGARQVGKTTILRTLFEELKSREQITSFFTLEDPELLDELNEHPKNIFKYIKEPDAERRLYLFIDEIQYLKNPSNFLKYMFDLYSNKIKLIVTGSSAFYIDTKFKDSLAGRKKIFKLNSFSFSEFLRAKNKKTLSKLISKENYFVTSKKRNLLKTERDDLELLFIEYSTYGSYPQVILQNDLEEKKERLKELHTSFLKKDIYDAGLEHQAKFYKLVKILASQVGQLLNTNELANTLNLSQNTVSKYLFVLEKSFIIGLCKPFYRKIRKELTKMPKIFFLDNGFRNSILNYYEPFNDRLDAGSTFENIFYTELNKNNIETINFWRTQSKTEIDFILNEKEAFELKLNKKSFSKNKYTKFTELYTEIPLKLLVPFDKKELDIIDFTK